MTSAQKVHIEDCTAAGAAAAAEAADAPVSEAQAPSASPGEEDDEEGKVKRQSPEERYDSLLGGALRLSQKVLEHTQRTHGPEHSETALYSCALASVQLMANNTAAAHDLLDANVPILQQHLGASNV